MQNIAGELKARGLVDAEAGGSLEEFLAQPRTVYLGIDPTADSLQVGNLVPVMLMKHLATAGHKVLFLVGGGTGMIGDPKESGERPLADVATVARNKKAISTQLARILGSRNQILDNYAWLSKLTAIEFLRDIGKHFTVNQLIKRDIIKRRLDTEEDSISYTEFSYALLQGYDFLHLFRTKGVDMQIGGSDQWANIISGVDLIRRTEGASAFAITTPIVTDKRTGKKFGKSEGNAVWLDPKKTSPYAFYQFWLNVSDEGLGEYVRIFTMMPRPEIDALLAEHERDPGRRIAHRRLAWEVTALVHGARIADTAARISEILFGGGSLDSLRTHDRAMLLREAPLTDVEKNHSVAEALIASGLASSKSEARRLIEQKGVSIGGVTVIDPAASIADYRHSGGMLAVRRGKRIALLRVR